MHHLLLRSSNVRRVVFRRATLLCILLHNMGTSRRASCWWKHTMLMWMLEPLHVALASEVTSGFNQLTVFLRCASSRLA